MGGVRIVDAGYLHRSMTLPAGRVGLDHSGVGAGYLRSRPKWLEEGESLGCVQGVSAVGGGRPCSWEIASFGSLVGFPFLAH